MTILECLIIVGIIIVALTLAFLCVKWGIVGFYRGKEVFRRQKSNGELHYKRMKKLQNEWRKQNGKEQE